MKLPCCVLSMQIYSYFSVFLQSILLSGTLFLRYPNGLFPQLFQLLYKYLSIPLSLLFLWSQNLLSINIFHISFMFIGVLPAYKKMQAFFGQKTYFVHCFGHCQNASSQNTAWHIIELNRYREQIVGSQRQDLRVGEMSKMQSEVHTSVIPEDVMYSMVTKVDNTISYI